MKEKVDNCYQCNHYHSCYLRLALDCLLDEGHHKLVVGGKAALKNSIPRPFLQKLAEICNIKELR